ncbi:hypothetical protein KJ910_04700 [Patescibacteria group bacterium]|nr:hypothetical protein [Patescibacteria group bacterium]MBU1906717.1 hypothetical protein [Patescibacteria group bacterium]
MKYLIIFFALISLMGAGCLRQETYSRYTPYVAPYGVPFYFNDSYTDRPFELTIPDGWTSEDQPDASLVIFADPLSNDHITLQIFREEDPTGLIRAHLNEVNEDPVTVGEFIGTKLVGQGESEEAPDVTHTILATDAGWFVFSSEKNDQNYLDVLKSFKLK